MKQHTFCNSIRKGGTQGRLKNKIKKFQDPTLLSGRGVPKIPCHPYKRLKISKLCTRDGQNWIETR